MNEFELRAQALRLRYKGERREIQSACFRTVGHLNTAIGQVTLPEAKEALRAEKERVKEVTRHSMVWHKICYLQQVEILNEEQREYYRQNPSSRSRRSAV